MGLKQGTLAFEDYGITSPVINKIIDINSSNVNDTDIWVQNIDNTGSVTQNWTNVSSLTGNNVIYNSLVNTDRFIHSTESRSENAVSVKFSDGNFGEIPSGTLRVWYRTSRNEIFWECSGRRTFDCSFKAATTQKHESDESREADSQASTN